MSSTDKPFLYQINFNRKKFPEVCKKLEEAKESENGLAWYLRNLIEKDIEEEKARQAFASIDTTYTEPIKIKDETPIRTIEETPTKAPEVKPELPDDNGGFA